MERKKLDYRELHVACQVISNLSSIGLDTLDQNTEDFILALKAQSVKPDCSWRSVLKSFEFQAEIRKCDVYLNRLANDSFNCIEEMEEFKG